MKSLIFPVIIAVFCGLVVSGCSKDNSTQPQIQQPEIIASGFLVDGRVIDTLKLPSLFYLYNDYFWYRFPPYNLSYFSKVELDFRLISNIPAGHDTILAQWGMGSYSTSYPFDTMKTNGQSFSASFNDYEIIHPDSVSFYIIFSAVSSTPDTTVTVRNLRLLGWRR